MKKVYVANIPYSTTEQDLEQLFCECGEVLNVNLITDRDTGRPRGFGFIEFGTEDNAQAAVSKFNGHEMDGRPLTVKIAEERRGGNGGGRGGQRRGAHSGGSQW